MLDAKPALDEAGITVVEWRRDWDESERIDMLWFDGFNKSTFEMYWPLSWRFAGKTHTVSGVHTRSVVVVGSALV